MQLRPGCCRETRDGSIKFALSHVGIGRIVMSATNPWKNSRVAPGLIVAILLSAMAGGWFIERSFGAWMFACCWLGILPGLFGATVAHYRGWRTAGQIAAAMLCSFLATVACGKFLQALNSIG